MITCRKCNQLKPKSSQSGNLCKDCYLLYQKQYRESNHEILKQKSKDRHTLNKGNYEWVVKERARGRQYWKQLQHEVIMAYGGYVCSCCGESEPLFLTIDHIHNDGANHRRSLGYKGNGKGAHGKTLKWLKDNKYPLGFQILCMNCNMGKQRNKGICPHKQTLDINRVNSVNPLPDNAEGNTEPSRCKSEGVTTIPSGSTLK